MLTKSVTKLFIATSLFLFFNSTSVAEILDIGHGFKINIPENMSYDKRDGYEVVLKNLKNRGLTKKEIKYIISSWKDLGFGETEDEIYISSPEALEFEKRDGDVFGKAENDLVFAEIADTCRDKKSKKAFLNCLLAGLKIKINATMTFSISLSDNESSKLKRLNSLSDSEISTLGKKEIKNFRKEHAGKFKFKSKGGDFKEIGIRNIRITSKGDFYIEERSIVKWLGFKTTYTHYIIPFKNRAFIIQGKCFKKYCKGLEDKMAKIIEPIFALNHKKDETYDFDNKQKMIQLVNNVRKGYRIYKIAKLLIILI